jgi:hypothetical protein
MRSGVTTGLRPRFTLVRDASLSAVAFDGNCASVTATILLTFLLSFSLWIRIALAGCSEGKGQRPAPFSLAISLAIVSGCSLAITLPASTLAGNSGASVVTGTLPVMAALCR